MPRPKPSNDGAPHEHSEGLDLLIKLAGEVKLIDEAIPGWTLIVSLPTDEYSGSTELEIAVDSTDPVAVDRLLQRVQRVRNSG